MSYRDLHNKPFDKGTIASSLEKRDTLSWQKKSWVIGLHFPDHSSLAVDWNELLKKKIIEGKDYVLVITQNESAFFAFKNQLDTETLSFEWNPETQVLTDRNSRSSWNTNGLCIEGKYQGKQLQKLPAYKEFWHSWKSFHFE